MKKSSFVMVALGIYFLFLIQMAGTLVESIYILDLMNTSLDEKVLGLLFFFTPLILFAYRAKRPALTGWILVGILALFRGFTPYLPTLGRMLTSGIAVGAALNLFPLLLTARVKGESRPFPAFWIAAGFALGVGLSILLRTANSGLDYSLFPNGGWVGWLLGAALGYGLGTLDWGEIGRIRAKSGPVTLSLIGIFLIVGLAWFAFSAPSVISRWTEGNYLWIVIVISALTSGWAIISNTRPDWLKKISPGVLLAWNVTFALAITLTLLAHRIPFPVSPDSPYVVVGQPTWIQTLPLGATLLLFPVIYLDLQVFAARIRRADPGPRDLIPGVLWGSLTLVILVFFHIFSNVWGYVEPISPWFRNKFWLPYVLLAGLVTALVGWRGVKSPDHSGQRPRENPRGITAFLLVVFLGSALSVLLTSRIGEFESARDSLLVMTYNIQGANNDSGERSVEEQLALIRQVDPDVLALQESDMARVSLNNNDFVRYFSGRLGYHSYYGPTTTTGTYGTAILSKYPLLNPRTIFSYSDQDEVGTAAVEIEVGGKTFTIYNVHPAGSDTVMLAFAETLLDSSAAKPQVIALGDYNLRDYEEAYQLIDSVLTNAWVRVYPSKISPDGVDMSGENRIDHIFYSADLEARNPVYVLPPASATDHPVHWTEIIWEP